MESLCAGEDVHDFRPHTGRRSALCRVPRMSEANTPTGIVTEIWRYPVKSMQGEQLTRAELGPLGINGDRRFAVRDLTTGKILSAKTPKLARDLLTCTAHTEADSTEISITVAGETFRHATDQGGLNAALSTLVGFPVALVEASNDAELYASDWPELDDMVLSNMSIDLPMLTGTFADLEPLHLLTTASIAHLASLATDSVITAQRFRPGILINTPATSSFVENDWQGASVGIGSATIRFGAASPRCIMTTVAQPGLDDDKVVLQTIAKHNKRDFAGMGNFACLGVYAKVTAPGTIAVGDHIIDRP